MLIVTQETISSWLKTYLDKGLDELCKVHFKGSSPKLSPEQITVFKSEVESHLFQTTKEACAWVKENFDIIYSERAMRDLLKRYGYTRQKAHLIPGKADPEAQSFFLEAYRETKAENDGSDPMLFSDAVHFLHNVHQSCYWSKKGQRPSFKANTGRN